ncbi:hypothetical protein HPT27_10230 [Permianibacter sp. IMCC34836]|uniref:hypothetical protein n=1 Tax=Permianibacter fluminis TaxID=2738515 RepID=UPI001555C8CC|nr:hypothetical protein [Permianibacter fluminis]NQD37407.1 hypothetical protein [Permianibacter fluminis]
MLVEILRNNLPPHHLINTKGCNTIVKQYKVATRKQSSYYSGEARPIVSDPNTKKVDTLNNLLEKNTEKQSSHFNMVCCSLRNYAFEITRTNKALNDGKQLIIILVIFT